MIKHLSDWVAKWMEREGAISDKDNDLFSYAVYSLLFGLLPIIIAIILGFAFGMLREGLLMILPFMLIRKFSGGYHLDSPKICVIFSIALLALAMVLLKVVAQGGYMYFLTVMVSLSVICLCVFSPVENSARMLTNTERRLFRKTARVLAVVSLLVYLVLCETTYVQCAAAFGVGILLVACLQLPTGIKSVLCKLRIT